MDSPYADIEKLDMEQGDTYAVIARPQATMDELVVLKDVLSQLGRDKGVLFILVPDGTCLKRLSEEDMNAFGWYRRCG